MTGRCDHHNGKLVKPEFASWLFAGQVTCAAAGAYVTGSEVGTGSFLRAWLGAGRALCPAGRGLGCYASPACGSCRHRASLCSHQPGSPWGAVARTARVPTSRNRVRAGCGGTAHGHTRARGLNASPGSSRPPGKVSAGRRPCRSPGASSHARRRGDGTRRRTRPAAMRASQACPVVIDGPQPAQQGGRARGAGLPVGEPVRCRGRSGARTWPAGPCCGAGRPRPRARRRRAARAGRGGRSGSARSWWPRCAPTGSARRA